MVGRSFNCLQLRAEENARVVALCHNLGMGNLSFMLVDYCARDLHCTVYRGLIKSDISPSGSTAGGLCWAATLGR